MKIKQIHITDLNADKISLDKFLMNGNTNSENYQKVLKILKQIVNTDITIRQQQCIYEHYFNKKKMKDIAVELGIAPSTVTKHIQRGASRIYKILKYYKNVT